MMQESAYGAVGDLVAAGSGLKRQFSVGENAVRGGGCAEGVHHLAEELFDFCRANVLFAAF
jgi:hypothetical protein